MTARALVDRARRAGVTLTVEAGALRFRARRGALTAELRAALKAQRDAVRAIVAAETAPPDPDADREAFEERAGIRQYLGGLSRPVADLLARLDVERMSGHAAPPSTLTLGELAQLFDAEEVAGTRRVLTREEEQDAIAAYARQHPEHDDA